MQFLKEAMSNKDFVHLAQVGKRNPNNKDTRDWMTIGVIASKTETKRSAVGITFTVM